MVSIRATGDWRPGEVSIAWTDSTWAAPPEVHALIDAAWQKAASRPGVHLFDGPMCRLETWDAAPRSLRLVLSRTSYRVFVGTNMTHPEIADRHGPGALANPVGLSALLETSDGWLLLGRRSPRVAYYPSRVHPFAGALEPTDGVDAFDDIRRELREELGFAPEDIGDIRCRGLVEDGSLRQPELIFRASTPRTRAQVEAGLDHTEHRGIYPIRARPDDVDAALQDPDLTPVAMGVLLLYRGRISAS